MSIMHTSYIKFKSNNFSFMSTKITETIYLKQNMILSIVTDNLYSVWWQNKGKVFTIELIDKDNRITNKIETVKQQKLKKSDSVKSKSKSKNFAKHFLIKFLIKKFKKSWVYLYE